MRKFFSIFVAVAMCVCLCIPAFAADTDSLASLFEGVDVNSLSDVELASVLDGLNLEGVDLDSIRAAFSDSGSSDALSGITDSISSGDTSALSGITDSISSGDTSALSGIADSIGGGDSLAGLKDSLGSLTDGATGSGSTDSLFSGLTDALGSLTGGDKTEDAIADTAVSGLSSLFGGMDMSWLSGVVSDPESLLSMFTGGGASAGGFDFSSIMDMISGAFGGNGLDLSALTSGIDLGSFDIGSVLGGLMGGGSGSGDVAGGISDKVAGISDMLKSGLESMGLDPSIADKLLDNEIVNFFANLFIGLGDLVNGNGDIGSMVGGLFGGDDSSSGGGNGGGGDYSAPVTPATGDNGAVFAAFGVLCAASCAAYVCLKKKRA